MVNGAAWSPEYHQWGVRSDTYGEWCCLLTSVSSMRCSDICDIMVNVTVLPPQYHHWGVLILAIMVNGAVWSPQTTVNSTTVSILEQAVSLKYLKVELFAPNSQRTGGCTVVARPPIPWWDRFYNMNSTSFTMKYLLKLKIPYYDKGSLQQKKNKKCGFFPH